MLTSAVARDLMTRGYCILRLVCDKAKPGEPSRDKTLLETINFIKSLFRLSWTLLIVIIIILESQTHLIHGLWVIRLMTISIGSCVYITCTGYRYRKSLLSDKGFRERFNIWNYNKNYKKPILGSEGHFDYFAISWANGYIHNKL